MTTSITTFGSCFPLLLTKGKDWRGTWFSERLDPDLLLSVSSLLTGRLELRVRGQGSKYKATKINYRVLR